VEKTIKLVTKTTYKDVDVMEEEQIPEEEYNEL
jgi:hypothetical protein